MNDQIEHEKVDRQEGSRTGEEEGKRDEDDEFGSALRSGYLYSASRTPRFPPSPTPFLHP